MHWNVTQRLGGWLLAVFAVMVWTEMGGESGRTVFARPSPPASSAFRPPKTPFLPRMRAGLSRFKHKVLGDKTFSAHRTDMMSNMKEQPGKIKAFLKEYKYPIGTGVAVGALASTGYVAYRERAKKKAKAQQLVLMEHQLKNEKLMEELKRERSEIDAKTFLAFHNSLKRQDHTEKMVVGLLNDRMKEKRVLASNAGTPLALDVRPVAHPGPAASDKVGTPLASDVRPFTQPNHDAAAAA